MRKQLQLIVAFLAGVLIASATSAVAANSGHHQGQIHNLKANDQAVFGTLVCQAFGPSPMDTPKEREKEFSCAEDLGVGEAAEYTVQYGTKWVTVSKNGNLVLSTKQHAVQGS